MQSFWSRSSSHLKCGWVLPQEPQCFQWSHIHPGGPSSIPGWTRGVCWHSQHVGRQLPSSTLPTGTEHWRDNSSDSPISTFSPRGNEQNKVYWLGTFGNFSDYWTQHILNRLNKSLCYIIHSLSDKNVYYYLGNRCLVTNLWLHSAKEEREKKKNQHHKSRKPGSGTSDLFNPHPLDQHEVHLSWSHTERAGPTPEEEKGSTLQELQG